MQAFAPPPPHTHILFKPWAAVKDVPVTALIRHKFGNYSPASHPITHPVKEPIHNIYARIHGKQIS